MQFQASSYGPKMTKLQGCDVNASCDEWIQHILGFNNHFRQKVTIAAGSVPHCAASCCAKYFTSIGLFIYLFNILNTFPCDQPIFISLHRSQANYRHQCIYNTGSSKSSNQPSRPAYQVSLYRYNSSLHKNDLKMRYVSYSAPRCQAGRSVLVYLHIYTAR